MDRKTRHGVRSDRTLLGGDHEPAHLDDFGQIPADLARQLARDTVDAGLKLQLRRLYAGPDRRRVAMDSLSRLFLKGGQIDRPPRPALPHTLVRCTDPPP